MRIKVSICVIIIGFVVIIGYFSFCRIVQVKMSVELIDIVGMASSYEA